MTDEQAIAIMAAQFYIMPNGPQTREQAIKEAANFLAAAKDEVSHRYQPK